MQDKFDIFDGVGVEINVYDLNGKNLKDSTQLDQSILNKIDDKIQVIGKLKFLRGKRYIFCCSASQSDAVLSLCNRLAECSKNDQKTDSVQEIIEKALAGEINGKETVKHLEAFNLPNEIYVIIYMDCDSYEEVAQIYPSPDDVLVKLRSGGVAAMHFIESEDIEDIREFVMALADTVEQEIGKSLHFGVSEHKKSLDKIREAGEEAIKSVFIHQRLNYKTSCAFYHDMLLERIAMNVPEDKRREYCERMFSKRRQKQLTPELMETIESFLAHDLNLGETAKHLYIHSNTLTYRLKKINKIFDIDIKSFSDANIFKILLIMKKLDKFEGETNEKI